MGRRIEHWADTALEASSRKESTKTLCRNLARKHLSPAPFGATPLDRLRKTHIDGLIVALRKRELSGSTVRSVYTVLRAILDDAKLDGLVAKNAAAKMPRPRRPASRRATCRRARLPRSGTLPRILRYRPTLTLIAATGLRRGERSHWPGTPSTSTTAH